MIDRFGGGGSTARSGGVVYAGGGSALQQHAGYADDPEQMFEYLRMEVRDAVDEAVLRPAVTAWRAGGRTGRVLFAHLRSASASRSATEAVAS